MKSAMRILLVTKSTGGVAEYIRWLVTGLDKERFLLTVACLSENGPEFAKELHRVYGVQTLSYAMNRYKVDLVSDVRAGLWLARLMRNRKFDLIHAHASKPGFLVRLAALGTHTPVLYSPHCFAFHAGTGKTTRMITSFLERLAAFFTTRFVVVSDGECELARDYRVGKERQFTVINTGIDPLPYRQTVDVARLKNSLGIPASAPIIGSVGRLSDQKSPFDFVRAAEAVHASRPDAHFVWVGDGPLESDVRRLSDSLQLESVMHWLGQRNDVPNLLHLFDCFLLTSRWEGFPLVILEAMAAGVPVVATDIFGTRDAIQHGINGWLAPVGDTESLARFILDLLEDPAKSNLFRSASCARIDREFTRERMIAGLQNLYQQVGYEGNSRK
jgi:glycosyltransferase involved in cell wall biosynthesis